MRGRRFFVASLSSVVWPAVVVLVPAGITFAAARVYAESSAPVACDAAVVVACADGGEAGAPCMGCGSATCACRQDSCGMVGATPTPALFCAPIVACADAPTICAGKNSGDTCTTSTNVPGACTASKASCLPDSGNVEELTILDCVPTAPGADGTSSGTSGSSGASGNTGDFEPGPSRVPGSSSSGGDDSGCTTTPGSVPTTALFAVPLGIGLLFAMRKRQPRKEPRARKRS